ncbi:MAG: hypothetical protein JNL83_08925 [Myxococcales bacterium]|nr:hypothetical protein [Myxococcales bacterium]
MPRRDKPFSHWLAVALTHPLRKGLAMFALATLALALITFVCRLIETAPGHLDGVARSAQLVGMGLYALLVVDLTARGGTAENGGPLRLLRAVVATAIIWAPGVIHVWLLGVPRNPAADPILWIFGVEAAIYLPLALAVATTDISFAGAVHPFRVFEIGWGLGRSLLGWTVAVVVLGTIAGVAANATTHQLRASVTAPLASDVVAVAPALLGITVVAALIGLLSFVHGDVFGWGDASLYRDPLHPELRAEGVVKATRSADEDDAGASRAPSGTIAPSERADAAKLADALKTENLSRALRIYESRPSWSAAAVDARKLIVLANGAVRAKQPELAARMLEEAHARGGRTAGQALLALAHLKLEVQGQPDEARALYQQIVDQHAGTEAARIAAKRLAG